MFLKSWVEMGGFELNHYWHRIDVLVALECALLAMAGCTGLALISHFVKRSRRLTVLSLIGALSFATAAWAANTALSALTAAGAISSGNLFYVVQTAGVGGVKATATQVATFINSLFSGDCTVTSGGAITCTKTSGVTFGALATVAPGTGVSAAAANATNATGGFVTFGGSGGTLTANITGNAATATSATSATSASAVPLSGVTGLGTGVGTALGVAVGSAGSPVVNGGALGTPSSGVGTALTALNASNLASGTVAAARGGAGTITGALKGSGAGVVTQAACADLSNGATGCSTAVGTSGATIGLLNAANTYSATQTYSAITLTGASGCATFTAGVLGSTGSACGSGGSTTITAGTTPTSGFTSGHFVQSNGSTVIDATAVTSVSSGCGTTTGGSPITTTGTVAAAITRRANTATTDAIISTDCGNIVSESNAASIAVSIAQAGTTGFAAGTYFELCNIGVGTATVTPATSTIGGASTYALPGGTAAAPKCVGIQSDGTNYNVVPDWFAVGTAAAQNTGTSGATLPFLNGTNTWSGTQTFGSVFGSVTTQSGATYTLASTDCGTEIAFTNAAAVTVTIPAALTTGCNIAILQTTSAGQVTVTGTAVSAATLHSAHSYTKTFGQWAVIGINIYTTGVAILTGDGA